MHLSGNRLGYFPKWSKFAETNDHVIYQKSKKLEMKTTLTILLLIVTLVADAQHQFGIKINGAASKMTTVNLNIVKYNCQYRPSYNGGLFYNFNLTQKSIIGAELLFAQIEGREHYEYISPFTTTLYTTTLSDNDTHLSYLEIPIYYGLKFDKLTLRAGVLASVLLKASQYSKGYTYASYGLGSLYDDYWDGKSNLTDVAPFDFGINAGILFNLSKKIAVECSYYQGFNYLIQNSDSSKKRNWKIQQISLGIRYAFFSRF